MDDDGSEIRIRLFGGGATRRNCVNESANVCGRNLYYFVIKWLSQSQKVGFAAQKASSPLVTCICTENKSTRHRRRRRG